MRLALDADFRKMANSFVTDYASMLELAVEEDQTRLKRIWKYENEYDFLYGNTVGTLNGMLAGFFKGTNGRSADPEEATEIREIVESHANEIRTRLAKFKK